MFHTVSLISSGHKCLVPQPLVKVWQTPQNAQSLIHVGKVRQAPQNAPSLIHVGKVRQTPQKSACLSGDERTDAHNQN